MYIIDWLCGEKYKNGKISAVYAWIRKKVDCFKYILVLILFHHAATNHKKDGNLK